MCRGRPLFMGEGDVGIINDIQRYISLWLFHCYSLFLGRKLGDPKPNVLKSLGILTSIQKVAESGPESPLHVYVSSADDHGLEMLKVNNE